VVVSAATTRAWLRQQARARGPIARTEGGAVIDWARIPDDQVDAIKEAIAAGAEPEPDPGPPETAGDAVRDWLEEHRKGGYVTFETMEAALLVLADWVDRCSLPIAEGEAARAAAEGGEPA
jgi:hypothetical protein